MLSQWHINVEKEQNIKKMCQTKAKPIRLKKSDKRSGLLPIFPLQHTYKGIGGEQRDAVVLFEIQENQNSLSTRVNEK